MPPIGISVLGLLLLFFCGYFSIVESHELSNFISGVPEGVPGIDYPDYTSVPRRTNFNCRDRKPGFYADPDTRCQVWHWCDTFLIKHSFLCPNLTVFSQKIRGCDWWYNVDCNLATSLYGNNDELYKVTPEEEAREAARKQKELNDRLDRQRGFTGNKFLLKPDGFERLDETTEASLNDAENDFAFSSTVQSDLFFSPSTTPPPPPPPPPPTTTQPPETTTTTQPPPTTTPTHPPPAIVSHSSFIPVASSTLAPLVLQPRPVIPQGANSFVFRPIANAISITGLFPTRPPTIRTTATTTTTLQPIVADVQPPAVPAVAIPQGFVPVIPNNAPFTDAPVHHNVEIITGAPVNHNAEIVTAAHVNHNIEIITAAPVSHNNEIVTVVPVNHNVGIITAASVSQNAETVTGAPVNHNVRIITAAPVPTAVNFRRRPSRLRPQTLVQQTAGLHSSTLPSSTTVEAFDSNPSTVSDNSIPLNENRFSDPQFIEDTTRSIGTTVNVESLRLVPSSHSQGTNGDFVEPGTVTTSSSTLNNLHSETSSVSTANQFPAFPSTTPQRIASFRPSFQPFPTTTPSVSRIPPSTVTSTFVPKPTEAFNFGVAFGSRIHGEASNNVIASMLAPHETNEISSSSAAQDVFETTTAETFRHRKFISNGSTRNVPTFPPFPITTFSPKTTTVTAKQEISTTTAAEEVTTSEPISSTTAFIFNRRRGANKNNTLSTNSIEADTQSTTFASTELTKLPIITAKHRTFPSFPITTFRPSTTPAEFGTGFGQRDNNNNNNEVTEKKSDDLSPSPTTLNDDVSLSR